MTSSFLVATPGCAGSFITVSLYVHGLISFGAIVGAMIATSGDEAFVMLSLFPREAVMLVGLLFVLGTFFSWLNDKLVPQFKFKPSPECPIHEFYLEKESFRHYLTKHIWSHIIKRYHIRVFLWTFVVLFALEIDLNYWNLSPFCLLAPLSRMGMVFYHYSLIALKTLYIIKFFNLTFGLLVGFIFYSLSWLHEELHSCQRGTSFEEGLIALPMATMETY